MHDLFRNKSVAVVGNASSLFEKEYGKLIDNHNMIIRFNKPAIFYNQDVEKSHGKKITTWAFFSHESFVTEVLDKEENVDNIRQHFYGNSKIIKLYAKNSDLNEKTSFTYPRKYNNILKMDIANSSYKYKISNMKKVKKRLSSYTHEYEYDCTTGLKILHWLSMSSPMKVDIFGFDFKVTPTFSEKERFETEIQDRIDIRCKHNFEAEEVYVKNVLLKRKKNFRLYE